MDMVIAIGYCGTCKHFHAVIPGEPLERYENLRWVAPALPHTFKTYRDYKEFWHLIYKKTMDASTVLHKMKP